jgi:hypothetical protein
MTFMRSQSALMVLPYDVFLFASLQGLLASRLGVEVGTYTHISGSFHVYEDELEMASAVIAEDPTPIALLPFIDPVAALPSTLAREARVRQATREHDLTSINKAIAEMTRDPRSIFDEALVVISANAARRLSEPHVAAGIEMTLRPELLRLEGVSQL